MLLQKESIALCVLTVAIVTGAFLTFGAGTLIESASCTAQLPAAHYWYIVLALFVGWGIVVGVLVGTVVWHEAKARDAAAKL